MTKPIHILAAMERLSEMAELSGEAKLNPALNAIMSILDDVDDEGRYVLITSLVAHLTSVQPDPQGCLGKILATVVSAWATVAEQHAIADAMAEKNSGAVVN